MSLLNNSDCFDKCASCDGPEETACTECEDGDFLDTDFTCSGNYKVYI